MRTSLSQPRYLKIILTDNGGEVTNKLIKGIYGREKAVGERCGRGQGVERREG